MFQKGNKLGVGRPRISLTKPELLLPLIFSKGNINWAADFIKLYKIMRERATTHKDPDYFLEGKELEVLDTVKRRAVIMEHNRLREEKKLMDFFLTVLPYLCTKVQLKEIDGRQMTSPADSAANARQTSELLKALEGERNGPSTPQ